MIAKEKLIRDVSTAVTLIFSATLAEEDRAASSLSENFGRLRLGKDL
jgi:hypothetical protein